MSFLLEGLEVLAWFEADGAAWGDIYFCAGSWVAAHAGFTGFDGEDAEAAEFDAVALGEGVFHGSKDGVDGGFGLVARQAGTLHDALNEVLLDHAAHLSNRGGGGPIQNRRRLPDGR